MRSATRSSDRGESWEARLATIGIVTAVTVLIWTWAAGKTESVEVFNGVEIRLGTTDPDRLRIAPATIRLGQLTATGSTRSLRRFRELPRRLEFTAGRDGVPAAEGTHTLSVAELLSEVPEIAETGLTFESEPPTIEVEIVALEPRTLRVEAEIPGVSTQGDTEVQPPTVEILLPASLQIPAEQLFAVATVGAGQLQRLEPGRRETVNASLRLSPELAALARGTSPRPSTVRVTFTPRVLDRETTLPRVPVQVAGISEDFARYRVTSTPAFLEQVVIRGPAETIGRIEAGTRVLAFVHLTTDELESAAVSGNAIEEPISLWLLPTGVEVRSVGDAEGARPVVTLQVERVAASDAASPGD